MAIPKLNINIPNPLNKKKPFIDKNNAVTFHLVHRSQRDPLQASDEAPQLVLSEDPGSKRKEELRKYGVYFEDDYDYLQHLRDSNEVAELMEERVRIPRKQGIAEGQGQVLQLPSSVFGSQMETTTGLLNKAVPITGPQLDWDPDIVAAMDEDFDLDDPENQLEDDFIVKANAERGPMDGSLDNDDADSDIASDEADISGSESGNDEYGDDMFMNEETRSRFTNYSLTSSVMRRNEGLTLLDDRFEMLYEQYDDTEIGALDHEEIDGCVQEGSLLLDAVLQEYEEAMTKVNLSDVLVTSERAEEAVDSGTESDDSQMVKMVIEDPRNKWDCESILSTYSNIYNHPRLIEEPRKGDKIKLTSKLSIPVGVLSEPGMTRKQVEKDIQKSRTADRASTYRPRQEALDEKHSRKQAIKEERKERRQEKKANKMAFKEEKRKQEQQTMNVDKNLKGIKMT